MKALVVYDSVFGNTEQIARAIGGGLGSAPDVQVLRVGEARPEQVTGVDLLVVGSPTRGFRPTPATKDFVAAIAENGLQDVRVAAFDTRIAVEDVNNVLLSVLVRLFGYAAAPIAKGLERKGGRRAAEPEGFIVEGREGPLRAGELERAEAWGRRLSGAEQGA